MGNTHVVVDGSNIATEGRTTPSLGQLDDAVRSFVEQYPRYERVTVIVDATFGHRIDAKERKAYEEAVLAGELVAPPAGTIGRGDAFILQVARIADADVLSNDSFQELHPEHPWLFEAGRLWGGKPVPEVGWVFVARSPVRGLTSRKATQAAKRASKRVTKSTAAAKTAPPEPLEDDAGSDRPAVDAALAAEQRAAGPGGRRRRRRGGGAGTGPKAGSREPANDQLPYASFVIEHPVGSNVKGTVARFSSHGAYVSIGDANGYVPLKVLGDPPPRSAREVLSIGEERDFTVARFHPATRGIDLVPVDVTPLTSGGAPGKRARPPAEAATAGAAAVQPIPDAEEAPVSPAAKKRAGKKTAARKSTAKKAARKAAPRARKAATAKKRSTAKKSAARRPAKKKAAAKRAPARKATKKKATARKAAAKKRPAARKAAKKKAPARKASAKKRPAARKAAKKR